VAEVVNHDPKMARKAAMAAVFGTVIEWYDFFLYGTAAALIFPQVFFPASDAYAGTLQSFAIFAVGFVARPVGGLIFGHFGDRMGRKKALMVTIFLMGISSFLMGCIPSYNSIGVWAPLILVILRVLQGIAVGGEWGGAILLSMEWGKKNKQGFMSSLPSAGIGAGLLLSSAVVSLMMSIAGDGFYSWGWRVCFFISMFLVVIGVLMRRTIEETPSFREAQKSQQVARMPIIEVLKKHPRSVICSAMVKMPEHVSTQIYMTAMISIATTYYHLDKQFLVNTIMVASILMTFNIVLAGYISDKVGIKRMYMIGVVLTLIWAFPYVAIINIGIPLAFAVATILAQFPHQTMAGCQGAIVAQSFPVNLRYSGASMGVQIAAVFSGGIAPLVSTYLMHTFGTIFAIGWYLVFVSIVGIIGTALIPVHQESPVTKNQVNLNAR
jgi:MFS family permease